MHLHVHTQNVPNTQFIFILPFDTHNLVYGTDHPILNEFMRYIFTTYNINSKFNKIKFNFIQVPCHYKLIDKYPSLYDMSKPGSRAQKSKIVDVLTFSPGKVVTRPL